MLLLKYLQLRARFGWSLSNLVALLRYQLFAYRDLQTWLNEPYQPPPAAGGPTEQPIDARIFTVLIRTATEAT
jgi:hypothetical protein